MNKKNVPEIRFSGFGSEWENSKLNGVAFYDNGKAHEKYIVNLGKFKVINSRFVSTDGNVYKYTKKQIKPLFIGDITMVLSDVPAGKALAKTFFIKENDRYTLNQRVCSIRTKENNHNYFLNKIINRNPYFLSFDDGVNQTNLSVNDVLNFSFNIPSFKEQEKIGALFENLDELIVNTEKKYIYYKNIKESLLNKMFPNNYSNIPDIRFKGFEEDWKKCPLYQKFVFLRGNGLKSDNINKVSNKNPAILYGHLYTNYGETIDNVSYGYKINIMREREREREREICSKSNDLLFPGSSTVPLGTAQCSSISLDNVLIGADVIIARPINNDIYGPFLSYQINSKKEKMYGIVTGTTIAHMYGKDLKNLEYSFTRYSEQTKIGELFKNLDDLITLTKKKHEKLKNIKNALLNKMFC